MKLIKTYIRTNMMDKVVHALEEAGFSDMTIIDVKAIRNVIELANLEYSVDEPNVI